MFFTSLLCSSLPAFAQAPRNSQVAAKKRPTAGKCSGAWTGVVTFMRTHKQEDTKRTERVSMRGVDVKSYEIKGEYSAQIVVSENPTRDGSSVARANVAQDWKMTERTEAVERNSCDQGKTWKDMRGTFTDKTEITGNQEGVEANVQVGVNADGSYRVGVGLPQIMGKLNGLKSAEYAGQCKPKEGHRTTFPETAKSIDGHSLTSDGRDRVNPDDPNSLSGSYSFDLPGGVVETITWNLRRCGGELMITDLKLYQPLFPSENTWIEIKDNGHTVDGNLVRVVATVVNLSGRSKQTYINFKELKEGSDSLPDGKMIQLNLDGGEEREVPVTWDTSGYAWKPGSVWSSPEIHRQIEVKLDNEQKARDVMVKPKPVVVVPGLWSNPELVFKFIGAFKSIPSTEWTAELARVAISKTAVENIPVIDETVKNVQKAENAWHVDMVAHSTGGLMARSYVHGAMPRSFDGKPTVTQLVMVGTPNMGTPCSTGLETIFTKIFSRNVPAFNEVSIKNMKTFNERIKARKGTKFSVLVGNAFDPNCQMDGPGDGITPNRSAIWTIKQWKFSTVPARHENQLGQQANFTQIVNWLAIPPNGDHRPQTDFFMGSTEPDENFGKLRRYGAMAHLDNIEGNWANVPFGDENSEPDFAAGTKLGANQTSEVAIPVTKGSRFSVTFLAPPNVSATLTDASGAVIGKITAGTPEAEGAFRTITVKKPFEAGTWKIKFENSERSEAEIAIVAFIDFNSDIFREPIG
jgi:hypothetical protein